MTNGAEKLRAHWIVECPKYHPGEYFALCECGCGRHHWTKDVHQAAKFGTQHEAETARGGDVNCVAVEHLFGLTLPSATRTPAPSSDIEELVERLRNRAEMMNEDPRAASWSNDFRQAADTLLAIQGERDALAKEAYEEGVEDGIAWHCFPESGPRPTWEARAALTATG
jgi:hypothetical protein